MNMNDTNFQNLRPIFMDETAQKKIKEIYPILLELGVVAEWTHKEIEDYKKQMTSSFEFHREQRAREIIETEISENIKICGRVLNYLYEAGIYKNYTEYKDFIKASFLEGCFNELL